MINKYVHSVSVYENGMKFPLLGEASLNFQKKGIVQQEGLLAETVCAYSNLEQL
jgi:hypothetical protein